MFRTEGQLLRASWKLGKVVELHTGKDGEVRGAAVKVASTTGSQLYQRPITKLYPLEVCAKSASADPKKDGSSDVDQAQESKASEEIQVRQRPTRTAAVVGNICRQLIDQWLEDGE